ILRGQGSGGPAARERAFLSACGERAGWPRVGPPGAPGLKERWKGRCGLRAAPGPPRSRAAPLLRTALQRKRPGYAAHRSGRGTLAPSRASPARSEAPPTTSTTSVATAEYVRAAGATRAPSASTPASRRSPPAAAPAARTIPRPTKAALV